MPTLNLAAVSRGEVDVRDEVAPDDPLWEGTGLALREPLRVELRANPVGEGILLRGRMATELQLECRRCLKEVPTPVDVHVDLLFEPQEKVEEDELEGEVYPIPPRGSELDLGPALREQLLLQVPHYVVCDAACRGLCPQCGADLNQTTCSCVPPEGASPWDALNQLKFD
jgi:uncharacterized protein